MTGGNHGPNRERRYQIGGVHVIGRHLPRGAADSSPRLENSTLRTAGISPKLRMPVAISVRGDVT